MSPRIKPETAPLPKPQKQPFRFRTQVWIGLFTLVALGVGAHFAWLRTAPTMALDRQYLLTAAAIHITPLPPWIHSDVKAQALRDSGLLGTLSVLDDGDTLPQRVKAAFEFQPWVASVSRIKRLPSSLDIDLVYRQPIAAVESSDPNGVMFLPIDEHAVRLPEADLTEAERRYLPQISGITGQPLVGDVWQDPRVVGGAKLAAQLADVWQQLHLVEIVANLQSTPPDARQIYRYEIVTTGRTRVLWGMTPGDEALTGESPFGQKRQRLLDYAAQHGKLESIDGPAVLDVRSDVVVTPRTARHKDAVPNADATQTK